MLSCMHTLITKSTVYKVSQQHEGYALPHWMYCTPQLLRVTTFGLYFIMNSSK